MKLSEELEWRGFTNQTTFTDLSDLDKEKRTFYWGVDPTASSMTVGNLAAAMMAKIFIKHEWKPILLVGGATGRIGDPDGKKQERALLSEKLIDQNKKTIAKQYENIFGSEIMVVDNYEWFSKLNYLKFLREIGKNVSVTQMLDRSFIQDRIGEGGSGITYAEFSYSLIQGYDYLHLFREHGATVQLAGADQWGNSIAGVDLIRRIESGEAHVYTCPLIVDASGKKFGKSEDNAIWIDSSVTSAYKYYQFWLNTDDASVGGYIKKYTSIGPTEYEKLMAAFNKNPAERSAQRYLAYESTKLVHGQQAADSVLKAIWIILGGYGLKFKDLSKDDIAILKAEFPHVKKGMSVIDSLTKSEVCSSKSEARRLTRDGAVSFNGNRITEPEQAIEEPGLLKKGKNTFILIK